MPTVEVLRLGFPSADEDTVVGQGRDVETRERISFLVPPDQRLRVLAEAHAGRHSVLTLPLVGRKHELELLADALDGLADERSCRMVTVLGSAGVGKSRLVEEFLASGIGTDLVLRGRCLPYGQGITFWPISEIVRQASGMGERESIDQFRRRIEAVVSGDEHGRVVAERVAQLVVGEPPFQSPVRNGELK